MSKIKTAILAHPGLKQGLIVTLLMTLALMFLASFGATTVSAQELISPTDVPAGIEAATGGEGSIRVLARTILNYFLYFLGFVATIMVIFGGILYLTSGGSEQQTGKAKKILLYAVLGIIIILLSYALVNTILGAGTGAAPA